MVSGRNVSVGQSMLTPLQFSATSQTPADARHSYVSGLTVSDGQSAEEPVQFSATSQSPTAGRHSVVSGAKEYSHVWSAQVSIVHTLSSLQSPSTWHSAPDTVMVTLISSTRIQSEVSSLTTKTVSWPVPGST